MQGNNAPSVDNPVKRLDPRTKLALLVASFVVLLVPQRPEIVGLGVMAVLAHLGLAGAWAEIWRVRWLLLTLLLFSLGVWSWLAQGPSILFWRVSRESLAFGAATFLKLGAMTLAGLTLLATTAVEELFLGLVKLRLPYPVAFAFALALRWVPEVFATAQRVKEAQEARGLAWEAGGLRERLRRHLPLLAPIFLLTLRRSQTMAWALEARGFQMSPRRTYLKEIHMTWRDGAALAMAGVLMGIFIWIHWQGWDRIPDLKL
jgi:energy-coupling factor transport system permease protein